MTKINPINVLTKNTQINRNLIKKVALPIAGITGLSVLNGAPGSNFNEVEPRGYNLIQHKGSVDDGILETLTDKFQMVGEEFGITEKIETASDAIETGFEKFKTFIEEWGEQLADRLPDLP